MTSKLAALGNVSQYSRVFVPVFREKFVRCLGFIAHVEVLGDENGHKEGGVRAVPEERKYLSIGDAGPYVASVQVHPQLRRALVGEAVHQASHFLREACHQSPRTKGLVDRGSVLGEVRPELVLPYLQSLLVSAHGDQARPDKRFGDGPEERECGRPQLVV